MVINLLGSGHTGRAKAAKKGQAGYDNPRENIDPHVRTQAISTKELRLVDLWHVYGGFQDETETLALGANTWTHVTNATNDLFSALEAVGFTLSADVMTIEHGGDYFGHVSLTVSALNGKDYFLRVYNVTQSKEMGYHIGASTTGAGNYTTISLPLYLEINAGDELQLQIKCTDGTDPIMRNCVFYIAYLHE